MLPAAAEAAVPPVGLTLTLQLLDDSGAGADVFLPRSEDVSFAAGATSAELRFEPITVKRPASWSAETPVLYTLLLTLQQNSSVLEATSHKVGFRTVEVSGGQLRVNGQAVKIKGVNRHELHPTLGHIATEETMLADISLMKQSNINACRCSHFPPHPRWLQLCDQHGIYVVDEANIESHPLALSPETQISGTAEWLPAHVDRLKAMVHRDRNHACVIIW